MAYVGGKGNCYLRIVSSMLTQDTYIEVYLGDFAVVRAEEPSPIQIGVDVDPESVAGSMNDSPAPPCQVSCAEACASLKTSPPDLHALVYLGALYRPELRRSSHTCCHTYGERENRRLLKVVTALGYRVLTSRYSFGQIHEGSVAEKCINFAAGIRHGLWVESLWMYFRLARRFLVARCLRVDFRDYDRSRQRSLILGPKGGALRYNKPGKFLHWLPDIYPKEVAHALGSN
jgi:hypothetical protein